MRFSSLMATKHCFNEENAMRVTINIQKACKRLLNVLSVADPL